MSIYNLRGIRYTYSSAQYLTFSKDTSYDLISSCIRIAYSTVHMHMHRVGAKSGRSLVLFVPSTVVSDAFVMRILPLLSGASPRAPGGRPTPVPLSTAPAPVAASSASEGLGNPKARKRS